MKKLLTILALGAMVSSSQAAQINWGLTGQIKYDDAVVGNAGSTLTLVYLSSGADAWSTAALDIAKGNDSSEGVVVMSKQTNTGSMAPATSGYWTFDWGDSTDISSKTVAKGSVFAYLATTVQDGTTYYWASDTYTVTDSGSNWDSTTLKYTMSQTATSGPNNNWTAVPEPSVALMGLLGIGMLIRRRKA